MFSSDPLGCTHDAFIYAQANTNKNEILFKIHKRRHQNIYTTEYYLALKRRRSKKRRQTYDL